MYYAERINGRYYLKSMNPDHSRELHEITEEYFYDRWRKSGADNQDIEETQKHNRDIRVL